MSDAPFQFDDGAAYERIMGHWSRLAGAVFLEWLDAPAGLAWADVGCGNGAFTQLLFDRAGASRVEGIDPSAGQLEYARTRLAGRAVQLHQGSAVPLPFADAAFDAATMALVIFFVPEPERGVAEMARVVRPGGLVAAYAWDIEGGGFPMEPAAPHLRAAGIEPLRPPRADASTLPALRRLWEGAGLEQVRTRTIEVERTFESMDEWWSAFLGSASMSAAAAKLDPQARQRLQDALRSALPAGPDGRIRYSSRANAVAGVRPG